MFPEGDPRQDYHGLERGLFIDLWLDLRQRSQGLWRHLRGR